MNLCTAITSAVATMIVAHTLALRTVDASEARNRRRRDAATRCSSAFALRGGIPRVTLTRLGRRARLARVKRILNGMAFALHAQCAGTYTLPTQWPGTQTAGRGAGAR